MVPERNGQTDSFAISILRVSMLTRDKNRSTNRGSLHWRCVVQQWSDPQTWIKIVDRSTVGHAPGVSLQHGDSVTCTVNGMISVTSTLRHQVRDLHDTQRSKFTSMNSIHLQSCVPKNYKNPCIFSSCISWQHLGVEAGTQAYSA